MHDTRPDAALRARLAGTFDDTLRDALDGAAEVALVNFPNHNNPGDSAIWLGAKAALRRLGVRVRYSCAWYNFNPAALAAAHPSGPILINGGGNFGDLYAGQQGLRERLLTEQAGRHLIQLPQSIHFREQQNLDRVATLVARHPKVTLMMRDEASQKFAEEHFDAPVLLAPDCAFALGGLDAPAPVADGRMLFLHRLKGDPEYVDHGVGSDRSRLREAEWLRQVDPEPVWSSPARLARELNGRLRKRCKNSARWERYAWHPLAMTFDPLGWGHVRRGLAILTSSQVLITDKLHGHVMAVLAGIPHVVLDNSYGKVSGAYQTWTHESTVAHWAQNASEAVAIAGALLKDEL